MSQNREGGQTPPVQSEVAPTGMKKFYFSLGGNQMRATGKTLKDIDTDNTGAEDIAGVFLDTGGRAFVAYAKGDLENWQGYLKMVADGIYAYLGLPVPGEDTES